MPSRKWTNRRLLVVALICLVVAAPQIAGADGRPAKPDIVVIMVDDLGAIDERILERLPNIRDLFLRDGLRFDQAYAETPLCCPGRASFLTGQHTRRHGVTKNRARLLDPRQTIATALHDAGYWTMMIGKYLNHSEELADKTPPGWDRVAMLNTWYGNSWSNWWIDGQARVAGYHDRHMVRRSVRWLRRAPSQQPVFMWLNSRAPHWGSDDGPPSSGRRTPWLPSVEPRYSRDSRCAGIAPWKPANYSWSKRADGFPLREICRSLLTVDDMVGKVRDEMAAQGRNPVWMFTSDNGMAWGVDGYALKNVPQAGRLPVYFSGAGVVTGGTDALVSNIDFAPTLAELAGALMPAADGVSFAQVLAGSPGGREWLLEDHPSGGFTGRGMSGPWWGIRTREWHLVEWKGTHLYNVRTDPLETRDVHGLFPSEVMVLNSLGDAATR